MSRSKTQLGPGKTHSLASRSTHATKTSTMRKRPLIKTRSDSSSCILSLWRGRRTRSSSCKWLFLRTKSSSSGAECSKMESTLTKCSRILRWCWTLIDSVELIGTMAWPWRNVSRKLRKTSKSSKTEYFRETQIDLQQIRTSSCATLVFPRCPCLKGSQTSVRLSRINSLWRSSEEMRTAS